VPAQERASARPERQQADRIDRELLDAEVTAERSISCRVPVGDVGKPHVRSGGLRMSS
jgi:hypothetical protein